MPEPKQEGVKWLRKLDSTHVYPATERFLKRNDLFQCDIEGNLVSTGTKEAPVVAPDKPAPIDLTDDSANAEENAKRIALIECAKKLGIRNAHACGEETLMKKIKDAENALEVENAE